MLSTVITPFASGALNVRQWRVYSVGRLPAPGWLVVAAPATPPAIPLGEAAATMELDTAVNHLAAERLANKSIGRRLTVALVIASRFPPLGQLPDYYILRARHFNDLEELDVRLVISPRAGENITDLEIMRLVALNNPLSAALVGFNRAADRALNRRLPALRRAIVVVDTGLICCLPVQPTAS